MGSTQRVLSGVQAEYGSDACLKSEFLGTAAAFFAQEYR